MILTALPGRLRGVGLVELMVTMLIGAMITAGVIALLNANRQTFRLQDNLSVAQESGSFALDYIARDLRLAGYFGHDSAPTLNASFDTAFLADNVNVPAADGVPSLNDVLAVVYRADLLLGGNTCSGNVPVPGTGQDIENRYWVRTVPTDNTRRELVCQGFTVSTEAGSAAVTIIGAVGTPQALIGDVDSFQVLYGVDMTRDRSLGPLNGAPLACPESAAMPTHWVTATQLNNLLAALPASPPGCAPLNLREIVSAVRVAVLVRTGADVDAIAPAGQAYTVLDQTLNNGNFPPLLDGRVRRLFMTTVATRNAVGEIEP